MNIKEIEKLLMGATIQRYDWRKDEWEFFEVKEVCSHNEMFITLGLGEFKLILNMRLVEQLRYKGQVVQYGYMEDSWYAITVKEKEEEE